MLSTADNKLNPLVKVTPKLSLLFVGKLPSILTSSISDPSLFIILNSTTASFASADTGIVIFFVPWSPISLIPNSFISCVVINPSDDIMFTFADCSPLSSKFVAISFV